MIGRTGPVDWVRFSPDGKRLATSSRDSTAKVWDAETGQEIFTLKGHTAAVGGVTFSPDGTRLATGSLDGVAKVWDLNTGKETAEPDGTHVECVGTCVQSRWKTVRDRRE